MKEEDSNGYNPHSIIPKSEYGDTIIGDDTSSLPNVKSHTGIEIGDFLEVEGKYFRINGKLGAGGLSVLYKANEWKTGADCVIKWYRNSCFPSESENDNPCEKFWTRECNATAIQSQLSPRCMHYYGAVKYIYENAPEYYIALEFIRGKTLDEWIAEYYPTINRISSQEIINFIQYILLPLVYHLQESHKHGLIHRDITPKNIIIVQNPEKHEIYPILIDWGIAKIDNPMKIFQPPQLIINSSSTGGTSILNHGTPPELRGGYDSFAASDIYMLGHIMFYMLTGGKYAKMPLIADDYVLHPKIFNPNLPDAADNLVSQMTQFEPSNRIQTMDQVYLRLSELMNILNSNQIPIQQSPKTNSKSLSKKQMNEFYKNLDVIIEKAQKILRKFQDLFVNWKETTEVIKNCDLNHFNYEFQKRVNTTTTENNQILKKVMSDIPIHQLRLNYMSDSRNNLNNSPNVLLELSDFQDELEFIKGELEMAEITYKDLIRVISDFTDWVDKMMISQEPAESDDYSKMLTEFLRVSLHQVCLYCAGSVEFGQKFCPNCHKKLKWTADPQVIWQELRETARWKNFKCPKCKKEWRVEWQYCLECGLDMHQMIESTPNFD